jgi:putative ABC transport system permease protein
MNDLRHAIRALFRYKNFSVMAVLTLALAIGANTAIFSVARAVLLDPLPYPNASQIVMVWETAPNFGFPVYTPAPGNYTDWKAQNKVFQGMAALSSRSYNLTEAGEPERLQGRAVTYDFFSVLGVAPILGRPFISEEDQPEAVKVVMLSAGLWQSRFGSAPDIVGRSIKLDGDSYKVIGVMPPGFEFPEKGTQVWTPVAFTPAQQRNHGSHMLRVVARLRPGVSVAQASQDMDAVARRLEHDYPETNTNIGARVVPLRDELVGNTRTALMLLLAIVGSILLIASANLANLLLARAITRQKEIGVRIALGAGRWSLMRQLFTENLVLSAAGTVLGLFVAAWSVEFLSTLIPSNLTTASLVLDGRLMLFAFALGVVTTLLFGAVPARQAWRLGVAEAIQSGARSGEHRSTNRLRSWLVVSQTAFTFVLLVAGGLMLRTFAELRAIDPGFHGDNVLTMRTVLPTTKYRGVALRGAFYSQVLDRIKALPGVVDAGYTSWLPYRNWGGTSQFEIEGRPAPPRGQEFDSNIRLVTPGYIPAMGMTVLKGRILNSGDHTGTEAVAVINETMQRKYWPSEDPLDHRVRICPECPWFRIVGMVADIHQQALDLAVRPEYYVPFDQLSQALPWAPPQDLAVRASGNPVALAADIRSAVWAVDAQQPVTGVKVLSEFLDDDLAPRRFQTQLIGGFAVLALLLASLGVYGVLSYAVSQRQREIGVRMALGAGPWEILRLVTRQGMTPALIGVAIGFITAYGLSNLISQLLYGITPHDTVTFAAAAAVLLVVALLACWIPARRASRTDPLTALHYE